MLAEKKAKQKYKILVVDDEKKILIVARKVLKSAGYDVEVCLDPGEAAEIVANRGPIAVILTDNRMPGMRGTELLEQVKRVSPSTVRVLITAFYDQQLIEDIVNKGEAYRFIKKPIDFNKTLKLIRECVDQYEANRKSEVIHDSLKKLNVDNEHLRVDATRLSEKIQNLKKVVVSIILVSILCVSGIVGINYYQEAQRLKVLKQTSIAVGDWVVYDNDTALDSAHKLMWMTQDFRILERSYPDSWEEARDWVQVINAKRVGGYRDWRMPTIEEYKQTYDSNLTRLAYDQNKDYPVGYPKVFQNGGGYGYWSAEEVGGESAKYFFFAGGYDKTEPKDYSSPTMSIRLVRSVK